MTSLIAIGSGCRKQSPNGGGPIVIVDIVVDIHHAIVTSLSSFIRAETCRHLTGAEPEPQARQRAPRKKGR